MKTSKILYLLLLSLFILSCANKEEKVVEEKPEIVTIEEGQKPSPDVILEMLKSGNTRFTEGKSLFPNNDSARIALANTKNQKDFAYATVLSCSDSRVPVELIFDAGIMDLFIIRIAGNVCDVDEIGSIEYGLCHVKTPVLVILGHTQCGAVTAVTKSLLGEGHALERNIPQLVDNIIPAAQKIIDENKHADHGEIISKAIEENIWQNMENLFTKSPAVRALVSKGDVKVVGAIYDLETGKVNWLSDYMVSSMLRKAENRTDKETEAMATHHQEGAEGEGGKEVHATESHH